MRRRALTLTSVLLALALIVSAGQSVSRGHLSPDWFLIVVWLGAGFLTYLRGPRLEERPMYQRMRNEMLAYQRGERGYPWFGGIGRSDRGGPFVWWVLGALVVAVVLTIVVAALS